MATVAIDNGKRIEELVEIHHLTGPSYFLVSDASITRRISLETLRNEFNGDDATTNLNNVYYSVEKINELLNAIRNNTTNISNRLDLTDKKYNDYYIEIMKAIANIQNDIEERYQFLFKWLDTLDAREARHYENLCEWLYKLRNDIRERLRDLDFREQYHWADQENRILSLEYRMTECDKRLDDHEIRIDYLESWKYLGNLNAGGTSLEILNTIRDSTKLVDILKAIDSWLKKHEDRLDAIDTWREINSTFTILKNINKNSTLDQILVEIDNALKELQEKIKATDDKLDDLLDGWHIKAGTEVLARLSAKTIYFQYFDT